VLILRPTTLFEKAFEHLCSLPLDVEGGQTSEVIYRGLTLSASKHPL